MPWAHIDGEMFVIGSDGFSASGFGFFVESDQDGVVSIVPQGICDSSWLSFDNVPHLRSTAGAGIVVYDGTDLLASRQPILWDVRSPGKFTSQHLGQPFGEIATPPAPGSSGRFGCPGTCTHISRTAAARMVLPLAYRIWHDGYPIPRVRHVEDPARFRVFRKARDNSLTWSRAAAWQPSGICFRSAATSGRGLRSGVWRRVVLPTFMPRRSKLVRRSFPPADIHMHASPCGGRRWINLPCGSSRFGLLGHLPPSSACET